MIVRNYTGSVRSVSLESGGKARLMVGYKRDPEGWSSEFVYVDMTREELDGSGIEPGTPIAVRICVGLGES